MSPVQLTYLVASGMLVEYFVYRMQLIQCSFDDETSRSSAFLQLGDTMKSLPQVYDLMITLGGDDTRERMMKIHQSIHVTTYENTLKLDPRLFSEMKLILGSHTSGHTLLRRIVTVFSDEEIREWEIAFRHTYKSLL